MDETRSGDPNYRAVVGVRVGPSMTGRMALGMVVVTLGVIWTLDNLGIIESGPILRWWPVVLIAIGLAKLTGVASRRSTIGGGLFLIVGGWLLAEHFDLVQVDVWTLWPLALVAIGIRMLTRSAARTRDTGASENPAERMNAFAFMSGVVRKVTSQEFRGGDATAVMGGVKLDMRGAKPAPEGAVLDLIVCWGGIEITVPDHWKVANEATVLMGGLEDRTKTPPPDSRDTLILRGLVVMGGVELKN
jgi:hypothetical protein